MAHNVLDKFQSCEVKWVELQTGMHGVQMLRSGDLDISVLSSPPTTIALSPPFSMPVEVMPAPPHACPFNLARPPACPLARMHYTTL